VTKIEILTKNPNFDKKSKFWQKNEILTKNPNFDKKSKFWQKIEILRLCHHTTSAYEKVF